MILRLLNYAGPLFGLTALVAAGFSAAIWYLGPLLAFGAVSPLASQEARIAAIAAVVIVAGIVLLAVLIRRTRRDKALTDELVETTSAAAEAPPSDSHVQAELAELKTKLKDALTTLRKTGTGNRSLYELPWYVIIGPPGAGKTTAIVNSGLRFPLEGSLGRAALGGVGGTRNCDWWFTENAVLIDTAGRYTTQESDAEEDQAGWLGFLKILKTHRRRQPINGALIAISLSDLSLQDAATQQSHAAAIRRRLHELRDTLGVRFPVYVIFTKADLIAGFTEVFDPLGKEARQQVWGLTLPRPVAAAGGDPSPAAAFSAEFDLLLDRLNAQSLERLQQETDPQRRALIASFPAQIASIRGTAQSFLDEIFQDSRFATRHMLRGAYFTSGTQEGTPIDRLMLGMANTFGIGRQAIGSGQGSGRSFFLTRLFEAVIFPESGLVSADDKVERRYRWTRRITIAAALVVGLGIAALWGRSYLGNADLLARAEASVAAYQTAAAQIPGGPVADTDLPVIVPALNILRDLPSNPAITEPSPPRALTYGLYQGKVLGNQSAITYRRALNQHMLPRLLLRLEEQMRANMDNSEVLYEALKAYLMLGQQGPMSSDLVKAWLRLDWAVAYPGEAGAALRSDLQDHLTALLNGPLDRLALDAALVVDVQRILIQTPLAERVYGGIVSSSRAAALPDWRLTDIGGPAISRGITRASGKPLSDGIAGIYTYRGFNTVFLPDALGIAQRIQAESWVLGPDGMAEQSPAALAALSRDVLDLYYNDYVTRYDQMLADLDVIRMESMTHAVEVTNILAGPTSPLRNILEAVARETRLTESRPLDGASGLAQGVQEIGQLELDSALTTRTQVFLQVLRQSVSGDTATAPQSPGAYVEDRFAWLHDLVDAPEGQPTALAGFIDRLTAVYQDLNKRSFAADSATVESTALNQLQETAAGLGGPLPRWAAQITRGASGIAADGTRARLNALWQADILPFCQRALTNRYPFTPTAAADVALTDFTRLFAPGGMLDSFFAENLRQHVDITTPDWSWKRLNQVDLGISQDVLKQFQYAAEIRDAFFTAGATPSITFQVTPRSLDETAYQVFLELDGQEIAFNRRRAIEPSSISWPGAVGAARVYMFPRIDGRLSTISREGPWAIFRLFNAAQTQTTNVSDRTRLTFFLDGRPAVYDVQAGSVLNPFNLPAVTAFACPSAF